LNLSNHAYIIIVMFLYLSHKKFYLLIFTYSIIAFTGIAGQNLNTPAVFLALLSKYHVSPKPVDDAWSSYVFRTFLQNIDPNSLFITSNDLTALSDYSPELDETSQTKATELLNKTENLLVKMLMHTDSLLDKLVKIPPDFSKKEAFDAKSQYERTQGDVNNYNKAVADLNQVTKLSNSKNTAMNNDRNRLISPWSNSVDNYMAVHVPKYN
jgi:hypothetical protein